MTRVLPILSTTWETSTNSWGRLKQTYKESIQITRRRGADVGPGDDDNWDSTLASSLSALGSILLQQGLSKEGRLLCEEALVIFRRVHGDKDGTVTGVLHTIAKMHCVQGQFKKALKIHHSNLEGRRRRLGKDHNDVAWSLVGIGSVNAKQGQHDKALVRYDEALGILRRLGTNHPDVAAVLCKSACSQVEMGDKQGALDAVREAQRIYTKHRMSQGKLQKVAVLIRWIEVAV